MPRKLNIYSLSLNTRTCSYNKWSLFLRHCTELTFTNLPFLLRTYTQSTDICDIHVTFEKSNDWYMSGIWKVTFHIPDIYQLFFFNVLHTQITFCIVRETSTLCFLFICETLTWHTFSTCDWGLTVPEDLFISQDTCTID